MYGPGVNAGSAPHASKTRLETQSMILRLTLQVARGVLVVLDVVSVSCSGM